MCKLKMSDVESETAPECNPPFSSTALHMLHEIFIIFWTCLLLSPFHIHTSTWLIVYSAWNICLHLTWILSPLWQVSRLLHPLPFWPFKSSMWLMDSCIYMFLNVTLGVYSKFYYCISVLITPIHIHSWEDFKNMNIRRLQCASWEKKNNLIRGTGSRNDKRIYQRGRFIPWFSSSQVKIY